MATRVQSEVLTFLIADIRAYTTFTRTHGDEAGSALAVTFAEIAREGVEAHAGEILQLRGDETVAVFRSAREALRAAVELQLVFEDECLLRPSLALNVGIGLDIGEAVPVNGDYHGGPLNLAARLCASAAAGEVLASQGVAHAVRVADGLDLVDYGPLELKGFDKPVPVIRVTAGTPAPGRLYGLATRSELPAELDPVTQIVGRDEIVRRLRWSWRMARRGRSSALAVVGPTGIGKTRLAAEIAALAASDGARVAYTSFARQVEESDTGPDAERPAYVVFDDLHDASPEQLTAALAHVAGVSTLVLLAYDDERAPPATIAAVRRRVPSDAFVRPGPLDREAVRGIAALYVGAAVDALPEGVLEAGRGVPRLVHDQVARWVRAEGARRLGRAATETSAGREDLRSLESALASEMIELQVAREAVLLYGSTSASAAEVAPYKGLESFGIDDADRFFGREQLVADMVARCAGAPLLAIVGASGSGKSSALRAGLLPALVSGALPTKGRWFVALTRPGEHPLRELDRALWSCLPHEISERMAGADEPLRAARQALPTSDGLIVAVDQFEEVFTLCRDDEERSAYIAALVDAATGSERNEVVVVALRADYYGRCAAEPAFAELLAANHVLVGSMSAEEYRRAITRPALAVGCRLDPQLVESLVGDVVGEPGALPLLSSALLDLWNRREGRTITAASYAATGGVHRAVARLAEAAYGALDDPERRIARSVFLRLAGEGESGEPVRRRVPTSELDVGSNATVARVLDVLAAGRLVTVDGGTVEVAHEALLREWPRFGDWFAEDREGQKLHAHLSVAAREWDARGRDRGDLYRGVRLSSSLDWAAARGPELNELERAFIEAGRAENERELHNQRRWNRRLRALLGGALVLLAAALVAGALALVARGHARAAATAAVAERLGAQALTARDLDTSLLLAQQGVALDDTLQTRGNLEGSLLRSPAALRVYRPLPGGLTSVDVSRDGRRLLLGNAAGSYALVGVVSGKALWTGRADTARFAGNAPIVVQGRRVLTLVGGRERRNGLLPPGTHVAAVARTESVVAVTTGRPGGHPTSVELVAIPSGRVTHVVFPPAGTTITSVDLSDDGRVLLVQEAGATAQATTYQTWRLAPWRSGATIHDVRSFSTFGGALSPDDQSLVAGHPDGSVTVYSLANGGRFDLHGRHDAGVTGAAFSPDGSSIVSTGGDAHALVWDSSTGDLRETLQGHTGRVFGPAFGPGGATVYTAGLDGVGIAWDLTGTRRLSTPFAAGPGQEIGGRPVVSFALSPDGRRIAAPGSDGVVHIVGVPSGREYVSLGDNPIFSAASLVWAAHAPLVAGVGPKNQPDVWRLVRGIRQQEPARIFPPPAVAGPATAVALTPDARVLAVGTQTGRVYLFALADGRRVGSAVRAGAEVLQLAFSPDGRRLAAAAGGAGVFVWRSGDDRLLYRVATAADAVAFSPDGRLLASGGPNGVTELLDAANGAMVGLPLRGNAAAALSVSFSPDAGLLATGGSDGAVRIYDVASRQSVGAPLPGLGNVPVGAAFTPDGTHVVSFYANGRAFLFDLRPADWSRAACAIAGRRLTRAEWNQYLPGRPYRPAC